MKKMFAILLILAGSLALIDNLDIFPIHNLIDYLWPSFLILLGLSGLVGKNRNTLLSIILILIGSLFLLREFGYLLHIDLSDILFPVILIVVGVALLSPKHVHVDYDNEKKAKYTEYKDRSEYTTVRESNQREYNAILSSRNEKVINKSFKQVTINAILGGADIDLRDIELEDDIAYIDVNCIMGGCDIFLPKGFKYIVSGTPILGGLDNFLESDINASKTIEIHYAVVLGGIDLKH